MLQFRRIGHLAAILFACLATQSASSEDTPTYLDFAPKISPDGQKIAFYRYSGDQPDLYVMNLDGSGTKRLTFTEGFWEILPQWGPEGKRLFYTGYTNPRAGDGAIYVLDMESGQSSKATSPADGYGDGDVTVSWSENAIVFLRSRSDGRRFIMWQDLATGTEREIFTHNIENFAVGRNGMDPTRPRLLVTASMGSKEPPHPTDLYFIDTVSTRMTQITNTPDLWKRQAMISRDGNWLIYSNNKNGTQDLYKVPAEGGEPIQLTFFNDATEFFSDMSHGVLVFDAGGYPTGQTCLYRADENGQNLVRLTGACEFKASFPE